MKKFDGAYKSIGEVAKILNLVNEKNGSLNTHTLRFWEKEFKNINPKIFLLVGEDIMINLQLNF